MTDDSQLQKDARDNSEDRVEQMIWMYLDDVLPEEQIPELEQVLKEDPNAVQLYTECVKLHVDLLEHFGEPREVKLPFVPDSPVLGSLGDGMPGVDAGPPVT